MKGKYILTDEKRAKAVFEVINDHWINKRGVFEGVILPQDRWELPAEIILKALFLFYSAIFMRGGVISEDPFRFVHELYKRRPEYFNPFFVASSLTFEKIESAFLEIASQVFEIGPKKIRPSPMNYKIKEHIKAWIWNSKMLVKCWDGNPINIFNGVKDFEEAFARIDMKRLKEDGIFGMRRKIFSLYVIWLQENNLIPYFPTPIPVDFHALRILWLTGVIDFKNLIEKKFNSGRYEALNGEKAVRISEPLIDEITIWTQTCLSELQIPHLHINPALWVLSRDLCVINYQNSSSQDGKILVDPKVLKNPSAWPKNYNDPCLFCPVLDFCTGAVPSAPYYRNGILAKIRKVRFNSPKKALPGFSQFRKKPWNKRSR